MKLPDAAVKELASAAAARKGGGVELCPSPAFKKLAALLPPYLLWRAGDDLLAHLPDGLSPCPSNQAVASLGAAQNDPIAAYEDAGGATTWHTLLASCKPSNGGQEGAIVWQVVSASQKHAAAAAWELGRGGEPKWPQRQQDDGVHARPVLQKPGELLILPPGCLCLRKCTGASAVMLQWARVAPAFAVAALKAAEPCATAKPALPPPPCDAPQPPPWRRLQLHPPVLLATYLGIAAAMKAHREAGRRGGGQAGSEAALPDADAADLGALVGAVTPHLCVEGTSPGTEPRGGTATIDDPTALRACDLCGVDIFNRCVRIAAPLAVDAAGARARCRAPRPTRGAPAPAPPTPAISACGASPTGAWRRRRPTAPPCCSSRTTQAQRAAESRRQARQHGRQGLYHCCLWRPRRRRL